MTQYKLREHRGFFVVEAAAGEPGAADKPLAVFRSVRDARALIARRLRSGAEAERAEIDVRAEQDAEERPK